VPILTVLLQPVWGTLSDVFKKRRLLLIVACLGVSISMVGLGLSRSFIEAFLLSFLFSIFTTPIMPISAAIVLDHLEETGKPDEYGLIRVWGSIAYAISSLMLASFFLDEILTLFPWILAGIYLLLAVLSFTLPECKKSLAKTSLKDLKLLTSNPAFMLFLVGVVFIGATIVISQNYQTLFMQVLNASDLLIGIVIAIPALLEIPLMPLVPLLLKRIPMRWLILAGAVLLPIRWMINSLIQQPGWMIPAQFLNSIATISFEVVGVSFVDRNIDPKWRATGQGLYSTAIFGIGPGIGLYVAGNVMDWWNIRAIWSFNLILGVIGLGLVFTALWRFKRPSRVPADLSE
jgi:PPP family 3-phenylpropionic acid transporter